MTEKNNKNTTRMPELYEELAIPLCKRQEDDNKERIGWSITGNVAHHLQRKQSKSQLFLHILRSVIWNLKHENFMNWKTLISAISWCLLELKSKSKYKSDSLGLLRTTKSLVQIKANFYITGIGNKCQIRIPIQLSRLEWLGKWSIDNIFHL